jgi:hypothetical protein
LAKHLRAIADGSFASAQAAFAPRYAGYRPGIGIQKFLGAHWASIVTGMNGRG